MMVEHLRVDFDYDASMTAGETSAFAVQRWIACLWSSSWRDPMELFVTKLT